MRGKRERAFSEAVCFMMIAVQLTVPVLARLGAMTGRTLYLYRPEWEHEIRALLMLVLTILVCQLHDRRSDTAGICAACLLPVTFVCGFLSIIPLMHEQERIAGAEDSLCIFAECVMAAFIFFRYARKSGWKIASGCLAAAIAPVLAIFLFFSLIFVGFGAISVSEPVPSPDGTEEAYTVYLDSGALGGDLYLEIRESGAGVNGLIGRLRRQECISLNDSAYSTWMDYDVEWLRKDALTVAGIPVYREKALEFSD